MQINLNKKTVASSKSPFLHLKLENYMKAVSLQVVILLVPLLFVYLVYKDDLTRILLQSCIQLEVHSL
jgi:hypothetical protein